jgi:hypothetical protein
MTCVRAARTKDKKRPSHVSPSPKRSQLFSSKRPRREPMIHQNAALAQNMPAGSCKKTDQEGVHGVLVSFHCFVYNKKRWLQTASPSWSVFSLLLYTSNSIRIHVYVPASTIRTESHPYVPPGPCARQSLRNVHSSIYVQDCDFVLAETITKVLLCLRQKLSKRKRYHSMSAVFWVLKVKMKD